MHMPSLLAAMLLAAPEPAPPPELPPAPPADERPGALGGQKPERPLAPPPSKVDEAPAAAGPGPSTPKAPEVPPPGQPIAPSRPAEPLPEAKGGETKAVPERRSTAEESVSSAARAFYLALLSKDVDRLAAMSRAPFYFESRAVSSPEEIKKRWASALSSQPLESLRLLDVEVLSPEDMSKKYGKPPERLAAWPAGGGTYTVGNLSGHAAVVLWRRSGSGWQALAFHD